MTKDCEGNRQLKTRHASIKMVTVIFLDHCSDFSDTVNSREQTLVILIKYSYVFSSILQPLGDCEHCILSAAWTNYLQP